MTTDETGRLIKLIQAVQVLPEAQQQYILGYADAMAEIKRSVEDEQEVKAVGA